MSIQDDIFEVEDFVKDNEAASKSFERLYEYIAHLERKVEKLESLNHKFIQLKAALNEF